MSEYVFQLSSNATGRLAEVAFARLTNYTRRSTPAESKPFAGKDLQLPVSAKRRW